jgi:hypothetical protein
MYRTEKGTDWNTPDFPYSRLSNASHLIGYRGLIPECLMDPLPVIKHFDVIKDSRPGGISIDKAVMMDEFVFQMTEN